MCPIARSKRSPSRYLILLFFFPCETMSKPAAQLSSQQLEALLNGPAGPPPPGVQSNFNDPANLNDLVILTLTMCLVFAALTVLMRTYTKLFLIRSWDYEDYALLLGWLLQIGQSVPPVLIIRDGAGVHMWDLQLKTFSKLLYDVNVHSIVYSFTVFFIKLSILLQYLQVFVPTRTGNMAMFLTIHVVIWSQLVFYLLDIAFFLGLCSPRRKIWQPWLPNGHCFSSDIWNMASGMFNAISDIIILIFPMPCLWGLQMPLKKKLITMGIFATGSFACVTSVIRTYYTWKVVTEPDVSYNMVVMGLWTLAEVAAGVIVSCLPVLPRFFRETGPKVRRAFSIGSKFSLLLGSASAKTKGGPSLTSPTSPGSIPKNPKDSRIHNADLQSDSTELEAYNVVVSEANAKRHSRLGPLGPDCDVESGEYGLPIRDTFYYQTRLNTSF